MKDKWIKHFRKILNNSHVDPNQYTNEEILEIAKGLMSPTLCKELGFTYQWQFEIYWDAMMYLDPDPFMKGEIDMNLFKNRVEKNKN